MAFSSRTSETSDSGSDASGWTEREPEAECHDKRRGAPAQLQRINAHDLHLRHTAQMRADYIDELVQRRKKAAVPPSQNSIILAKLQDTRQYIDELVDENEAFASMVDTLRALYRWKEAARSLSTIERAVTASGAMQKSQAASSCICTWRLSAQDQRAARKMEHVARRHNVLRIRRLLSNAMAFWLGQTAVSTWMHDTTSRAIRRGQRLRIKLCMKRWARRRQIQIVRQRSLSHVGWKRLRVLAAAAFGYWRRSSTAAHWHRLIVARIAQRRTRSVLWIAVKSWRTKLNDSRRRCTRREICNAVVTMSSSRYLKFLVFCEWFRAATNLHESRERATNDWITVKRRQTRVKMSVFGKWQRWARQKYLMTIKTGRMVKRLVKHLYGLRVKLQRWNMHVIQVRRLRQVSAVIDRGRTISTFRLMLRKWRVWLQMLRVSGQLSKCFTQETMRQILCFWFSRSGPKRNLSGVQRWFHDNFAVVISTHTESVGAMVLEAGATT